MRNRAYSVVSQRILKPQNDNSSPQPTLRRVSTPGWTGSFHHKTHSLGDYEELISCWGLPSGGQELSDLTGRFRRRKKQMPLAQTIRSILDNNNAGASALDEAYIEDSIRDDQGYGRCQRLTRTVYSVLRLRS
ncbi:hypothetical protein BDW72DRAFT_176268 [Aspergillus terricola var. indicus]